MSKQPHFQTVDIGRDFVLQGEHPDMAVRDVADRPLPAAKIIVVANEKGGVGKSTLAFHLCIALADAGLKVAAVDLDRRQQSLCTALNRRDATARRMGIALPSPRHVVLERQSGSLLCQEIGRIGITSDVVIIDVAGSDSNIARRALAIADTLLTPINSSFVDIDLLGKLDPISCELVAPGCFSIVVNEIRASRARFSLPPLDWVVAQNRVRGGSSHNQSRFDAALESMAPALGFRLAPGLSDRVAYRELFLLGLTHLDVRRLPEVGRARPEAQREILSLVTVLTDMSAAGTEHSFGPAEKHVDLTGLPGLDCPAVAGSAPCIGGQAPDNHAA
jgi:chromosome partitioning protein